jgi:hypothetical protein
VAAKKTTAGGFTGRKAAVYKKTVSAMTRRGVKAAAAAKMATFAARRAKG